MVGWSFSSQFAFLICFPQICVTRLLNDMKYLGFSILFLFVITAVSAQNDEMDALEREFENYKQQENERFQAFREKENKAFAAFLKGEWKPFTPEAAIKPKPTPEPILPKDIVIPPTPPETRDLPLMRTPKFAPLPEEAEPVDVPEETEIPDAPLLEPQKEVVVKAGNTPFFGTQVRLEYAPELKVMSTGIQEKDVSTWWQNMSKVDYTGYLSALQKAIKYHQLDDWGTFQLIKASAESFHRSEPERTLFRFFMLNQIGYQCRIARNGNRLVLLMPYQQQVYGMPFLKMEGKKYYVENLSRNEPIQTLNGDFSKSNKVMSLAVQSHPKLEDKWLTRLLRWKTDSASIPYNERLIAYYNSYPQADLSIFFNAPLSKSVQDEMRTRFGSKIAGKNEYEAVSILLEFVQQSFPYQTDQQQFGKEKYFFPEEILHYPYSDCEDRSVFFARLVSDLTGLQVIGLHYEAHVAVAVKFSAPIRGDVIEHNGEQYLICDPTYIGASAGMAMPAVKGQVPEVIEVF